jgi:LmbE family N-acetylglucosaminyl deacetylase
MAPHPDDESLGCGGLIAAACAQSLTVRVIIVSDGTGSHPNSRQYPSDRLRRLREEETLAATAALGLEAYAVSFLRLPDRGVPCEGPSAEAAAQRIVRILPSDAAVSLFVTWRHDPHSDHANAFAIAQRVQAQRPGVRLLSYPIWGWSLPPHIDIDEGPPRGFRIEMTRHLPAKRRAIASHRSQMSDLIDDDPQGFRLDPAMVSRFERPFELYLESS